MESEAEIKKEMGILLRIYLDTESPSLKKECARTAYVALRWSVVNGHLPASDYIKALGKGEG